MRTRAAVLASNLMWAATGRRYGLCEVTALPCNLTAAAPLYQTYPHTPGGYDVFGEGAAMTPVLQAGQWFNRCGGGCSCSARCEVALAAPVDSIIDVVVDGVSVDPATYLVYDRHLLARTDGCWPTCQVYGTAVPGFEVTYLRGLVIPAPVQAGAEILACEYAKACTGGACRLPPHLTSLSRQGVDITVEELPKEKGQLRTGIAIVDDIIDADNPHGLRQSPQVYSPDLPVARTMTWSASS